MVVAQSFIAVHTESVRNISKLNDTIQVVSLSFYPLKRVFFSSCVFKRRRREFPISHIH